MESKVLLRSLFVNLFLTILKFVNGIISGSKTLLSDAVHSFSDLSTDIIGIIGSKLSNKKPDESHPYGHGKLEYLTSIIMSIFIISLGVSIIIAAFKFETKVKNAYALIVLFFTAFIKYLLSNYLKKKGTLLNSTIILTNATESKYDSLNSLIASIFVVFSLINLPFFRYADLIGSIVIAVLTIKVGLEIFISNIKSILGEVELDKNIISEVMQVVSKSNVIVKRVSLIKYGSYYKGVIDIIYDEDAKLKDIYLIEKNIKRDLKKSDLRVRYVTVNFEPKSTL